MMSQISSRSRKAFDVFFEQANCSVAGVAKKATHVPVCMIMIDAEVLKEHCLMADTFRRYT